MRAFALALAAVVTACAIPSPPPSEPAAASARPSIRGNRLIASSDEVAALEVAVSGPVAAGGVATASARIAAGARCRIRVGYMSGPSEAQGLEPALAGDDGAVAWTWIVGFATTPGEWPVEVTCTLRDGGEARGLARLTVRARE